MKHQNEEDAYYERLARYLRTGIDCFLNEDNNDPDGGYGMADVLAERIRFALHGLSPLRRLASVATIKTESLKVNHGPAIPVHELYVQPKTTQKELDESADIVSWLVGKVAELFARIEREAFLNGTGVGQPHGILTRAREGSIEIIQSGGGGALSAECVLRLCRSLGGEYTTTASFIMNTSTAQAVRLLQHSTGAYLWQPGLAAGQPDTLAGIPVHVVDEMPAAERGALAVAVGNFREGYQIAEREGIRILRDPFTDKPFVKFYTTKRVGGDVLDSAAIKVLRLAA